MSSSIDLKKVINELDEIIGNFHTQAMSLLSVSEQWPEVQRSFEASMAAMAARENRMELVKKDRAEELLRRVTFERNALEVRQTELNNREILLKNFEDEANMEKQALRKRREVVESKEKEIDERFRVLESKEVEIKRREEELKFKEKKIEDGFWVSASGRKRKFCVLGSGEVEMEEKEN